MPPATAAVNGEAFSGGQALFERAQLSGICCGASSHGTHLPLLIWSPGYTESRLEFSVLAQYVASYGYEVILVDHPGDAKITEFPDGEIVLGVFGSNDTTNIQDRVFALQVETQDVLFVIDSYSKGTCGASRVYGSNRKVGVVAHEAIAAQAMLNDSLKGNPGRIAGGVNLDGVIYSPVLTEGMGSGKKSFLLWEPASGPPNVTNWNQWWSITDKLDPGDWQKELSLANSTQGTFTDLPLLADVSGLRNSNPKLIDEGIGTISGIRSTSILTTYISAFFDMVLKGEKESLLSGPSEAYPEVSFVRSST
jgi:hypothetical protein